MRLAACAVLAATALVGCGDESSEESPGRPGPDLSQRREEPREEPRERPRLAPARCPASLSNCRVATGRIVYVEAVDPDGDGDAHFVLAGQDGVTGLGLTAVDVKRSLRPRPLPGVGDQLSAAGPIYQGSYGQRQIEAVEVRVRR